MLAPTFHTEDFSCTRIGPDSYKLVAEQSSLCGPLQDGRPLTGQFSDLADGGFFLVSHKTNKLVRCYHDHDVTTGDDLVARVFKVYERESGGLTIEVHILND